MLAVEAAVAVGSGSRGAGSSPLPTCCYDCQRGPCSLCHARITDGRFSPAVIHCDRVNHSLVMWSSTNCMIADSFPGLTEKKIKKKLKNKFGVAFPPHAGTIWRHKNEVPGWRTQQAPHWPASVCLSGWLTGFVKSFACCAPWVLSIWPTIKCVYVKHKSVTWTFMADSFASHVFTPDCEVEVLSLFSTLDPDTRAQRGSTALHTVCGADPVGVADSYLISEMLHPLTHCLSPNTKTLLITAFQSKASPRHRHAGCRISSCLRY